MNNKKFLLLWDIDGTLITGGGAGERAMNAVTERVFGVKTDLRLVDYRGRTDVWIVMELLKQAGVPVTGENLHAAVEAYLAGLAEELPRKQGRVLPGVIQILEQAAGRDDCVNALLTGNLARGAKLKLSHYAAWHYFEFGAFADDSHLRDDLGPVALRRALEKTGRDFAPENVYVIGDTPHDIACGKIIGAKTIVVATGGYTREQLMEREPTAYFDDLGRPEKFFELLGK